MKLRKFALLAVLSAGMALSGATWGREMHERHGDFHDHDRGFGAIFETPPLIWPWIPPVDEFAPLPPTKFIEREPSGAIIGYWYYCANPQGYYPNVEACGTPWQRVIPTGGNGALGEINSDGAPTGSHFGTNAVGLALM